MSPRVTITIEIPEGAQVAVETPDAASPPEQADVGRPQVAEYWNFITERTRELYSVMARREVKSGPFTLEEIAELMKVPADTVRQQLRQAGRGKAKYERDSGSPAPFDLVIRGSVPDRQIKRFSFPNGIAQMIVSLG
jgi:hypothetical protein